MYHIHNPLEVLHRIINTISSEHIYYYIDPKIYSTVQKFGNG